MKVVIRFAVGLAMALGLAACYVAPYPYPSPPPASAPVDPMDQPWASSRRSDSASRPRSARAATR